MDQKGAVAKGHYDAPVDSDAQTSRSVRREVARWISILGHPFVLIPGLVAAVTIPSLPPEQAAQIVGIVVLVSVVPMLLLMARRVRSGAWTNYDVSVREQRTGMYPAALAMTTATALVLAWAQVPWPILRGVLAILLLIGTGALVNRWLKISLHTAFAVFTALAFLPSPGLTAGMLALALAIAWSRLELGRHTLAEVIGGALLGTLIGGGLVLL
jgi:membrane-associated phospholipid phosphatase